jgi:solute carrier family 25 protein 33/36
MAGKREPSFSKNFIAGGLAGTIGAAITCPLEVVKTRLQSNLYEKQKLNPKNFIQYTTGHIKGVVHLLLDIRRQEGFRALWKGLGPNLVGVVPARSIYFSVYQKGKHYYSRMLEQESSLAHVMSAATAGTCTALCTNPIWLIKTRMQLQSEIVHTPGLRIYKNSFDCFKSVLKEEGIRGLYRGFSASLLGLTESTFQFAMYEYMKSSLTKKRNTDSLSITRLM